MLTEPAPLVVELPMLLAEGNRRLAAVAAGEVAGSLAVLDARLPEGSGPEQAAALQGMVAEVAHNAGAMASFDPGLGHYVLLLPFTRTWITAEVLQALARRLATIEVHAGWGRHTLRPSVGVSVVALAGGTALDAALTEAIDLARASLVERALRVYVGGSRVTTAPPSWMSRHYSRLPPGAERGPSPGPASAWPGCCRSWSAWFCGS